MNITEQILNPQEQPSITEQILTPKKKLSITEQVLYSGEPTEVSKILDTPEDSVQYLSQSTSEEATMQSKHLYGDNGPEIYTQEDLDEANEYEGLRVLEENDLKSISKTLSQVVEEGVHRADINRAAAQSAWDRFLSAKFKYDGGLRTSDLKQHQAEAESNNDFSDMDIDSMQIYQSKVDIVDKIKREITDKIYDRSYLKDFTIKYWDALKNVMPGYDALKNADMVARGVFEQTPSKNMRELHDAWHTALTDDSISPVQFEAFLRSALDKFDVAGTTNEELLEYLDKAFNMSTGVATLGTAVDLSVVGGAIAKTGGSLAKRGLKGASITATRMVAPYLNANGVKEVVRAGSSPIKTAKRITGKLTDVVTRKKFVGDVAGATETALKELPKKKDIKTVKELLGEPDVVNVTDPKTNKVTTVIEDILGEATQPSGSAMSNIAAEEAVLTTRAYNRLLQDTRQNLNTILNLRSVNNLQEVLKNSTTAFDSSIKNMLWNVKDDIVSKKKVGDLLKAIPAEEFKTDLEGSLVARVRLPVEYKSLRGATNLANKLNKTYAQGIEIIPLTSGKFAVEVDFNTHRGFGQILLESIPKDKGRVTWSGQTASAVATATGTPTAIRELDYIRSMDTDFFENMAKDTKSVVKNLSKSDRQDLEMLEEIMTDASKPGQYSPELLLSKGFSKPTVDAAMRLRLMRDVNFLVINQAKRASMMREGMRVITVNGRPLGTGVVISASDPEKAVEIVKASNRSLIIGNVDAVPVKASSLAELTNISSLSLTDQKEVLNANKATRALAAKLSATKESKAKATLRSIEEGLYSDTYEKIRKGEYIVLESIVSTDGSVSARDLYYVLPKNSVVQSDLPAFVMNYVPGWSRYYDRSAAFVKQARISNGKVVGVSTIFSSTHREDLEKTVNKIEELRKYVASNRPIQELMNSSTKASLKTIEQIKKYKEGFDSLLQELDISLAPFKNEKEFVEWAAQNRLDISNIDNPLHILRNNEVPPMVRTGSLQNGIVGMDKDTIRYYEASGSSEAIQSEWAQRQLHRYGGSVLDYDFSEKTIVDVDKTLQYFVDDMVREGIMPRYEEIYANAFGDQFRKIIVDKIPRAAYMDNRDILKYMQGDIERLYKNEKSPQIKDILSQAITAQKNYAVVRGIPNKFDEVVSAAGYEILRAIGSSADALHIPEKLQHGVRVAFDKIVDLSPIKLAQSIAAHRFLGCLNVVQATKNFLGPASLIIAAEPKHGSAALKDVFGMIHRLQKQDKNLARSLSKLDISLGTDPKVSDMILRNLLLLDTHSAGIKGGLLSEAAKSQNKLSRASLYFFNRADFANRVMAYDTALRKYGFHNKPLKNSLDIGQVGAYADALYVNMSKRGLSRLQSVEFSKVFTQFMGYMFKYAETLLCDKELTGLQRASMISSTLVLAGGGGILGNNVYHAISSGLGADMSGDDSDAKRVVKEVFANGIPDAMLKEFGFDVSVQNFFGPNVLEKLDDFTNKGAVDIVSALPAIKTITDYSSAAMDFFQFLGKKYGEGGEYYRWSDLLDQLLVHHKTVSSAEKLYMAYTMYNTGMRFSASGQLSSEDNSKLQALLSVLGFDSQKTRDVYLSQVRRQERKDRYQKTLKEILKYERLAAQGNSWAGSYARMLLNDPYFTNRERLDLMKAMNTNALIQSRVPLDVREWWESGKSKVKTNESTYK